MEIRRRLIVTPTFSLAAYQEGEDTFRVETDLHYRAGITENEAHKIIEVARLAVAGLTQRIGEMKLYSALSGYRDEELPLFRHKLDFLADAASSQNRERGFQRVMDIVGLPEFSSDHAINVDKLLKVRDSAEAGEFREWLRAIGHADEKEIKERVEGLRVKVGLAIGGTTGKILRCLVTSGLGFVPGQEVPALALTVLDQFLLDKLLPRSGVAAFVHELYPSIFRDTTPAAEPRDMIAAR